MPFTSALFALFVVVPVIEIALFIVIGNQIGLATTLALIVVTAVVGSVFVSRQGRGTLAAARGELMAGAFPGRQLAHGAMILLAGAFLITPGFLTDTIGFLLLVAPIRERLRRWAARRFGTGRTITL